MVFDISMTDERGPALLNRLLAERREAHRRYNEALTELDRAVQAVPDFPAPPSSYDETLLPKINESWTLLPKGAVPPNPSWWGSRTFNMVWRAIAPLFEQQMAFNAAIVEHLNRNAAAHREAHASLERALPALRDGFDALVRFESLLVQFLQTITPLSDTHFREIDDAITQLRLLSILAAINPAISTNAILNTPVGA